MTSVISILDDPILGRADTFPSRFRASARRSDQFESRLVSTAGWKANIGKLPHRIFGARDTTLPFAVFPVLRTVHKAPEVVRVIPGQSTQLVQDRQ